MILAHTEEVRLFRKVTGVNQALVQKIIASVKEAYIADICNCMTKSTNNTVAYVLTHIQENYRQLIPHKLLKREDVVKNTMYRPRDPIATIFSAVEDFLGFSGITGTSYTQHQAVNIAYMMIHRTVKFGLEILK